MVDVIFETPVDFCAGKPAHPKWLSEGVMAITC